MTTDTLLAQLKHPNPNLRDRAMLEIVETRDEQTISQLMSILNEADTTYRRAAVKTLGAIGMDTVPPLVEAMLNSQDVTVRGSATKALAQVIINYRDLPFPAAGIQGLKSTCHRFSRGRGSTTTSTTGAPMAGTTGPIGSGR